MIDFSEIALTILAVALGVAIGLIILIVAFILFGLFLPLLRTPIWPLKIAKVAEWPALRPDQLAAVTELESLGFQRIGCALAENGPMQYLIAYFRHRDSSALAELTFSRGLGSGYPVAFYSFDRNGEVLIATNRLGWLVTADEPHILRADSYSTNLQAHWQYHLSRLTGISIEEVDDEEALRRVIALAEGYFPLLKDSGAIVEGRTCWHPALRMAIRQTKQRLRVMGKMIRPYVSPVTNSEHRSAYYFASYQELEAIHAARSTPQKVKAWLLALSLIVSSIGWGAIFGWPFAVALIVVLAVHEAGHALAMHAFGYRDINMIFIPFFGAIVTGNPVEIPAWKHAIMLLAGPLPGLLAGLAALVYLRYYPLHAGGIDWVKIAAVAIAVNLINLLPISPLDGGRLIEAGLFSRWPRARLVFVALSVASIVAYAIWQHGDFTLAPICGFLIGSLATHARIVKLQGAWQEGLNPDEQAKHLFKAAQTSLRVQNFAQHYALVKAVFTHRKIQKPRIWESIAIISVMAGIWSAGAAVTFTFWHKPAQSITSTVSENQLKTTSSEIIPCSSEHDPSKAQPICLGLLKSGKLDKASQIMAYDKLAQSALVLKDYTSSLAWSERAIAAHPAFPFRYYLAGEAHFGRREFDKAIKMYDEAIKRLPAYYQAICRRGEAFIETGDAIRAKADFETALSLNPKYGPAKDALMKVNIRGKV